MRAKLRGVVDLQVVAACSVPVTASHCVSLGAQTLEVQRRVAMLLAAAEVSVVSLPQTNLYLQARGQRTSPARGIAAVQALLDAGGSSGGRWGQHPGPVQPHGPGRPARDGCCWSPLAT